MNLSSLVTEAQRLAGRVDSNFDDRTKQWINEALDRWCIRDPWGTLTFEEDFLSDGTRDLYLPNYMRKILSVFDKTNERPLDHLENWDRRVPASFAEETAGNAYLWREIGMSPVTRQPTSAVQLEFKLDQGDDVTCYIEGVSQSSLASGTAVAFHRETEYITCSSGVGATTNKNFIKIYTIGKSSLGTGDVIVRYDGEDPARARINADQYRAEYRHLQLLYKPGSGTEFTIRYIRRLPILTDDDQIVPPSINDRFLVWWAAGNIHSSMQEPAEAREKWQMAEKFLKEDSHHEKAFGDQDWDTQPDPDYYGHEDL